MELIAEVEPIGVEEDVAVCYGHEDPVLGHPVEFIKVRQHKTAESLLRSSSASICQDEGPRCHITGEARLAALAQASEREKQRGANCDEWSALLTDTPFPHYSRLLA